MPALALACVLVVLAATTPAAVAQPSPAPTPPLTNEDVIRMTRAQVAPGIIITTIESSGSAFDLSPDGLIALKQAGVPDAVVHAMVTRARVPVTGPVAAVSPDAPEKSELLAAWREPAVILRTFRTLYIDASDAQFFRSEQVKAALAREKGFAALRIAVVDDPAVADVVLTIGYTFAWDYPFSLRHQNTSLVLASGKGTGPFSGPAGAKSVARELVTLLAKFRVVAAPRPGS